MGVIVDRPHRSNVQRYYTHDTIDFAIQKMGQLDQQTVNARAKGDGMSINYPMLQSLLQNMLDVKKNSFHGADAIKEGTAESSVGNDASVAFKGRSLIEITDKGSVSNDASVTFSSGSSIQKIQQEMDSVNAQKIEGAETSDRGRPTKDVGETNSFLTPQSLRQNMLDVKQQEIEEDDNKTKDAAVRGSNRLWSSHSRKTSFAEDTLPNAEDNVKKKSERNPDDLSDRQLLARAYEGIAKTDYEKRSLERYK